MKLKSAAVCMLFMFGIQSLDLPLCRCAEEKAVTAAAADDGMLVDTSSMQRHPGFFTFYWDDSTGTLWIELDGFDDEFLYVHSLATGLGSNPVGLDRGQLGETRIVRFKRVADRVYLIQNNLKFRASSENAAEQQAVAESFAPSVIWGGSLRRSSDGHWLVDLTDFFFRDAHDVTGQLVSSGQGSFTLDKARSFMHLPRTRAFPDNTEFEVALTFESKSPGRLASRTAADGSQLTLRQHHSFVRLPDTQYRPRRHDPRIGCFSVSYADYSAPIDQPLEQKWITRHRLEKRDPESRSSPPVEPIVYYVDPGAPQPVRDALIEGARWWNAAFERAGFQDAFQVKLLPADADPMDVRYNVIQWVHRATRGWSYGSSVVDPRTGEIIKGHVTLGSLRIRQDHLLMQNYLTTSLKPPKDANCGSFILSGASPVEALADGPTSLGVALARIRQLSAHEVGHTLGFSHNFAASTYGDRASVMDYPAPRVGIRDGRLDLSDAYAVGVGEWDQVVVNYAYSEFPVESEQIELNRIVTDAVNRGLLYLTDADARPAGAAHPLGNLWDNGSDPVESLNHEMQVRRLAIEQFGESVLADGQPLDQLGVAFTPVYLHHRYQVEATAKMLGGLEYSYKIKGDTGASVVRVSPERQRAALEALLETIQPEQLMIPVRIQALIPPRIGESISDRERLESLSEPAFDPGNAIRTAADLTMRSILQPQRATRLAQDPNPDWGLKQVLDRMVDSIWDDDGASDSTRAARRIIRLAFVERLIDLAHSEAASGDVRAIAAHRLDALMDHARAMVDSTPLNGVDQAHFEYIVAQIQRFKDRPNPTAVPARPVTEPPGSPIGQRRD